MSRSGNSDDSGGWDLICWQGAARWYCSGPVRGTDTAAAVAMQKSILCELAAQMDVFHDSAPGA